MTSQVNFKLETKLKKQAMSKARREGVPFSTILKRMTEIYVNGDLYLKLVPPDFNEKTRYELAQSLREIDQGKGLSPRFTNAADGITHLENL